MCWTRPLRRGCPRASRGCSRAFCSDGAGRRTILGVPNAAFHYASLEQVSGDPHTFGGPFQVVLLVGTYHYLFWGSLLCPTAYHSHEEILRRLASICTDRLIISARFTVHRLPANIRSKLKEGPGAAAYTTEAFLQTRRSSSTFATPDIWASIPCRDDQRA